MKSRIQNIVFPLTDDMELNYELFYRGSKGVYRRDDRNDTKQKIVIIINKKCNLFLN